MLEIGSKITITPQNFKAHDADICTLKVGDTLIIEEVLKTNKVFRAVSNGFNYVIKNEIAPQDLESPYVTLFFGILTENNTNYNVYECLDTSLDKHLKGRTELLSDEEKDIVFLAALRGAKAFATRDLFYCDLKPENIAVSLTNGKITAAKLCDFDAMYKRTSATHSRCTSSWGSPTSFKNTAKNADIVLYPLGMLLFYLYTKENFWAFIESDNPGTDDFEIYYKSLADEAYAAAGIPKGKKTSILWHGDDETIVKLHSNYAECSDLFKSRTSNKLSSYFSNNPQLTKELTDIILSALVHGNDIFATNALNGLEKKYREFMHMRGTDKTTRECLVIIEVYRNNKRFEIQCFYIASGESINVPVCSFERNAERVIRGVLFLSAFDNEVYYCVNEKDTELALTPLSSNECIVSIDNIDLHIRLIS